MKPYGWALMESINSLDGVENPRPEIVECIEKNLMGVLHYVLGSRKSACGKCEFLTSFMDVNRRNLLHKDPYDTTNNVINNSLVCVECERSIEWQEYLRKESEKKDSEEEEMELDNQ